MCDATTTPQLPRRAFLRMMPEDLLPASELATQTQRDAISAATCVHTGICPFRRMKTPQGVTTSESTVSETGHNR